LLLPGIPCNHAFSEARGIDRTARHVSELIDQASRHGFDMERLIGICAKGCLAARFGNSTSAIESLRYGLSEMREKGYMVFVPFFQAELAEILRLAGRIEDGLVEIEAALHAPVDTSYQWLETEATRVKAQLLSRRSVTDHAAAEHLFLQSIERARNRQTLYWELRSATSLAEFWMARGRPFEVSELLAPIYSRFTEGFTTPDLRRAKHLLGLSGVS
jgi:non-specific serine/threonine protein kinase